MPLSFFRKEVKKDHEEKKAKELKLVIGNSCGKFCLEMVFLLGAGPFGPKMIVLAGRVLEGEIRVGYILKLPNGKMLRVKSLESRGKKVEKVVQGETVGIHVEGINWKPKAKDLEPYEISKVMKELKKNVKKKYSHLPKELAEKLVNEEINKLLRKEVESRIILVYHSTKT